MPYHGVAGIARRSTALLAFAVKAVAYILVLVILIVGAYGGRWYVSQKARVRDNADAFVSMFRGEGQCEIRRKLEDPGTSISCGDAGRYIRDELKVNSGGTVTIGASAETSEASMGVLTTSITREGFRIVSILKAGITNGPNRPR